MSTSVRLAKGAGLTLSRVGVSVFGQFATVPIYLSHWDAQTFGVWLIFQGMLGFLTLLSVAFQQYSYAELMQRGTGSPEALRSVYQVSVTVGYVIALLEFTTVLTLGPWLIPEAINAAVSQDATEVSSIIIMLLTLHSLIQLIFMPFGAITGHSLSIYGQYPRTAAWGLFHDGLVLMAPAVTALAGGGLMAAGLAMVSARAVAGVLTSLDLLRWAHGHRLFQRQRIDWRMGVLNALYCVPLAGQTFLNSFRQQGFRILLGVYASATAVTELATTRTFANVLHQGQSTITAPLMPELMRYVVNRDQDRMEGAFAIVWLSLFALLTPGVLLLCMLAEPVFLFWTQDVVAFDPVLFLTLLAAVLVYASVQPASAILQGQNRIVWMVSISVAAAVALAAFSVLLISPFGLRGAGFALLGTELTGAALTVVGAVQALHRSGLEFPLRSFTLVAASVAAVFALSLLVVTVLGGSPIFMLFPFAANVLFAALYWLTIPALARAKILGVLAAIQARLRSRSRTSFLESK